MMKRVLLIFLFLTILLNLGRAQTAMSFFNVGATLYIKGHLEQAVQVVQEGLQKFPDDPYLKALAEKLKEKKKQQQQQQQNQQQQQKKQAQKKEQQAKKEQQKKEQQKKEQQKKQSGKKKQMSKKEAERILRALKEQNKKFKKEHIRVPAGRRQMDKNW